MVRSRIPLFRSHRRDRPLLHAKRVALRCLTLGICAALMAGMGLPAQAAEPEQAAASRSVDDFKTSIDELREAETWPAVLRESREMQRQHAGNDEAVAFAMNARCQALALTGKYAEAISTADEIFSRFAASESVPIQEQVAGSMLNKGISLLALGTIAASDTNSQRASTYVRQGLAVADEVVERYGKSDAWSLQLIVIRAMLFKAGYLISLRRTDEAMAIFDAAIGHCGSNDENAASVRAMEAGILAEMGRGDIAIGVLDAAIARYAPGDGPFNTIGPGLLSLFMVKSTTLNALGRNEEAIAVLDAAIARFAPTDTPLTHPGVGLLVFTEAALLDGLGRKDEAIGLLDDLSARCAKSEVREIRELGLMAALMRSRIAAGENGSKDEPRH